MMAVDSQRIHLGRNASWSVGKDGWTREYSVAYRVTSDTEIGPNTAILQTLVQNSLTCPYGRYNIGTDFDTAAYATSISCEVAEESGKLYMVTIGYTTKLDIDPAEHTEDPLMRPAQIRSGGQLVQETIWKDLDGEPILNSAGWPFDPMPVADKAIAVFSIERNFAVSMDPTRVRDVIGAKNQAPFIGFGSGEVRCVDANSVGPQIENDIRFYRWSMTFHADSSETLTIDGQGQSGLSPWDLYVLDAGYYDLSSGSCKAILDDDNKDITSPFLLDGNGNKVDTCPPFGFESWRRFRINKTYDFNTIGII